MGQETALRVVYGLILLWAWLKYFDIKPWNKITFNRLIAGTIAFKIGFSIAQTVSQYLVWSKNDLTKIFLTSPSDGILNFQGGYFIFYALNRFWGEMILGIFIAWLFYKFLLYLKKYEDRFLAAGEAELGFLTALLVGWPGFVAYLPLFLVILVALSLIRRLFWGEKYTTLGLSMLLAASLILAFEPYFTRVFGLGALTL